MNSILICCNCELGFDERHREVDYENELTLPLDEKTLAKYYRFAQRSTGMLNAALESTARDQQMPFNILEIGPGYGFMSELLTKKIEVKNYYHLELNQMLAKRLERQGKTVIRSLDAIDRVDMVILGHVLEHIGDAKALLDNLISSKLAPGGYLILFQTNHAGFIPRYLPMLWYGWQVVQHHYHFTPRVFEKYCHVNQQASIVSVNMYSLDLEASFSIKGLVKIFLKVVNLIIPENHYDAFIIILQKAVR